MINAFFALTPVFINAGIVAGLLVGVVVADALYTRLLLGMHITVLGA